MKLFRPGHLSTALALALLAASALIAQSTNQNYPTPLTTNELTGTIKARDVGDPRLTSYYYQFDGSQGDLFINIVTRNFTGDIDVFTLNGLRPLTKVVVYADFGENETGRVIYLRKPEKMLLRVQGRTPGDDPATFRIKFAGSFVASTLTAPAAEPELPALTAKNESGIRVNSVGTIVEVIPKATPTPAPVEVAGINEREPEPEVEVKQEQPAPETQPKVDEPAEPEKKVGVVVTETIPEPILPAKKPAPGTRTPTRGRRRARPPVAQESKPPTEPTTDAVVEPSPETKPPATTRRSRRTRAATQPPAPTEPDPLEKVNLVILFKDGTKIERPMSEVFRFSVDKGVLTVIAKDGSIGKYSILAVARVTIE